MASLRELLSEGGPARSALSTYEPREGQVAMAEAVADAIVQERILLCEAGTGIGKTLAYLLGALEASTGTIVVSTATKALQDQLLGKDVPVAERILGRAIDAQLVKGLGNYLCRRRYEELRTDPEAAAEHRRKLPMLTRWVDETETGDLADASFLRDDDTLTKAIRSSSETRIGSRCKYFESCFVTKLRQRADAARVLIVNHHLFFADLSVKLAAPTEIASRVGVLPPSSVTVFDEAHQLEDAAVTFFGVSLTRPMMKRYVQDCARTFVAHQLIDPVFGRGPGATHVERVERAVDDLFDALGERAAARAGNGPKEARLAWTAEDWLGEPTLRYHELDEALSELESFAEAHAIAEPVLAVRRRTAAQRERIAAIASPATHFICWASWSAEGKGGPSLALGATPVELGPALRDVVWNRIGPAVLTSATLAFGGGEDEDPFRYVRARLGLDEGVHAPLAQRRIASPFDYRAQAMLYQARDLPDVADPSFADAAAARVDELIEASGGGAFVLCTSFRAMHAFATRLAHREPLVQGRAPKAKLLSSFRASGHGVLIATMSFWEGVDVQGDALRLVVIDKLPFAVPTDPVISARCNALTAEGKNAFVEYLVPQAGISLLQGFGRLIRSKSDRGVVAILDRRLWTKPYGRTLRDALPDALPTSDVGEVEAFFRARPAESASD